MCLLQGAKASLPSLSVAITATTLLPSDFTTDVVPKGSKAVSGLGLIGLSERAELRGGRL